MNDYSKAVPPLPDYYEILQVSPNAEQEVIQSAYKRLSLKYHPDTNHTPDANTRMRQFIEAYEIIGNPAKRKQYDRAVKEQQNRMQLRNEVRQTSPAPAAPAGAYPNICPQCKKDDRVKKVTAILEIRELPVLALSLEAPPPPTYPVRPNFLEKRGRDGNLAYYQKKLQEYTETMERWKRAMELWNKLYYCERNVCVFLPGSHQSAPLSGMIEYLYKLADNQ